MSFSGLGSRNEHAFVSLCMGFHPPFEVTGGCLPAREEYRMTWRRDCEGHDRSFLSDNFSMRLFNQRERELAMKPERKDDVEKLVTGPEHRVDSHRVRRPRPVPGLTVLPHHRHAQEWPRGGHGPAGTGHHRVEPPIRLRDRGFRPPQRRMPARCPAKGFLNERRSAQW